MLPAVAGMIGTLHHIQFLSVEMGSSKLFFAYVGLKLRSS
jgi:hypothetical protein